MNNYTDRDNNSNIQGYEASDKSFYGSWIEVFFKDGSVYRYTDHSAGPHVVQEMIRLAEYGDGLNSFINKEKPRYESKR